MNILAAMLLHAVNTSAPQGSFPSLITDTPKIKDIARRRLVKTNPDVDSNADEQADNAAFTGKKYRVQDTHYGHYISEHDDEDEAETAAKARPYSRVISETEWQHTQKARDAARKKLLKAGGPGSGRHKEIMQKLGYQHLGTRKSDKITADLFYHPTAMRHVLVHNSGAWSTKRLGLLHNGTTMKDFYNRYHKNASDQSKIKESSITKTKAGDFIDKLLRK